MTKLEKKEKAIIFINRLESLIAKKTLILQDNYVPLITAWQKWTLSAIANADLLINKRFTNGGLYTRIRIRGIEDKLLKLEDFAYEKLCSLCRDCIKDLKKKFEIE